jgi:hypothetical protein
MAKRELLIIALFGVAGLVAYQVLAPPSTGSERGAPFSSWLERARSGGRGSAVASVSRDGVLELDAGVTTLRVSGVWTVVVRGEPREDVGYQLTVESNGPDEARARAAAESMTLAHDVLGSILSLTVEAPPDARLAGALTLQVPARLSAIIDGARSTEVSGLAGVRLDRVVGDARLRDLSGSLTGGHRNGELSVEGAASVALNLFETSAAISGIRDDIRLTARNGETRLDGNQAAVEIDGNGHTARVVEPGGAVRIFGMGGEIHLTHPRDAVIIDVRRVEVTLVVDTAVPISVFTSERLVRLTMVPDLAVSIDARTFDGGPIDATALGVSPEITSDGSRVHLPRAAAPAIAIRNQRGAIEIAQTK